MMTKSMISVSMFLFSLSAFADQTSICAERIVTQMRLNDSYSDYNVRKSFMVKAGEPIIVDTEEYRTALNLDSEAVIIDETTMGVDMNIHVFFVNPSNCKVLRKFAVPPGI